MKTIVLLLFSFVVVSNCYAQIPAGTTFIGGSASFSNRTDKNTRNPDIDNKSVSTSYSLYPKAGYFITDNIALGLGINYYSNRTKYKESSIDESFRGKQHSLGINPFARYYKMLGEKIGFFGQFTLSYENGKSKNNDFIYQKQTSFGASLAPGFVFFATPKIGIETTIGNFGYFRYINKYYSQDQNPTEDKTNQLAANVEANNVFLGINFYFGR
ncbi:porin family protein [Adhaeribacter swui]|uniref:Porin family protein n=1 Tax=Adhaeribacter swui TaxID=2086471 RepID=A0A7G7G8K9_9BACT|nr:outer membrane beta-barrel protein [Adhaeribacter swui]QNF33493.1 porin family protein [Adhaeribacter swui]